MILAQTAESFPTWLVCPKFQPTSQFIQAAREGLGNLQNLPKTLYVKEKPTLRNCNPGHLHAQERLCRYIQMPQQKDNLFSQTPNWSWCLSVCLAWVLNLVWTSAVIWSHPAGKPHGPPLFPKKQCSSRPALWLCFPTVGWDPLADYEIN